MYKNQFLINKHLWERNYFMGVVYVAQFTSLTTNRNAFWNSWALTLMERKHCCEGQCFFASVIESQGSWVETMYLSKVMKLVARFRMFSPMTCYAKHNFKTNLVVNVGGHLGHLTVGRWFWSIGYFLLIAVGTAVVHHELYEPPIDGLIVSG